MNPARKALTNAVNRSIEAGSPVFVNQPVPRLEMRKFPIRVAIIPTMLDMHVFGAEITYEERTIEGYTLKDAKKRAGIE